MTKSVLEIVMEREKLAYGRSIPLCRNDKNEFLLPRNTEHGVWYKCYDPTCTACFFKRVRDGKAHMVIRSGEEHTGVSCASDSKRKTIMDLGKTLQGGLASAIMHPPARREKEPETDSSAGGGDTGIKQPRAPNVMEDYTRSMSSLKDLEKYGFTKLPNCELDDGMMTVDLFVNRNNAHYIMEDKGDLGARGMEVMPEGAFDYEKKLRFLLRENRASKSTKFRKKILDMVFTHQEEYEIARDKVFKKNPEEVAWPPYVPIYPNTVYVYGIWRASSKSGCRAVCRKSCVTGNSICTGHQITNGINADTQIYIPTMK